ncbi:uncharacterized protein CBL_09992 [Carabus blaptoides fortunei]
MAHLVTSVIDKYHDLMDNKSDPRVNQWFMMSSPLPTLLICISYAYIARVLGPRLMENRKPLGLRKTLLIYNALQTIFSAWIFYEYLQSGWWGHYSFRCQPVDYSNSPLAIRMAHTCWWYYFSKFTEFFDTLFFILRKKNQHVQFVFIFGHQFQTLFTDCNYPKVFMIWIGLHGVLFLFLFSDFYKTSYTKTSKRKNGGLCMPVMEGQKPTKNGKQMNGISNSNGSLNNSYVSTEYSTNLKPCYSNGINKGFVSNGKKVD